jgi:hypothetical protein
MTWLRVHFCLGIVLLASSLASAGSPPPKSSPDAVLSLAARIDALIEVGYESNNVKPAPLADDAEFVRRVYLDLAGRIPRVSEVHRFLDDKAPDKRRALVEEILKGPHYVNHFTNVWRALLLPQNNDQQVRFFAAQMENWLRPLILENKPYDRMVRDLLTTPLGNTILGVRPPSPAGDGAMIFYQVNESKPENVAAATSRLFLGIKLECAQCHDHPFASWSRNQFWQYAAFFSGIRAQQPQAGVFSRSLDEPRKREIKIPNTEKTVQARFLDGTNPEWKEGATARAVLADWLISPKNPYFAKAIANRLWGHFFGIGIIDPVDDLGEANPPSHPELLDELGRAMVEHHFDMQFLIRAITASRTYQRASRASDPSQDDPHLFARMSLKGLSPEQVFDSLAIATGYRDTPTAPGNFNRFNGIRAEFLTKFANGSDKRTEYQTSILQALSLMNGKFIADATSVERSETLAALADAPFLDDRQRLDALYLAALGRPMRDRESSRVLPYLQRGGPSGNKSKALADVFWALINSSEFIFNH